MNRLFAFAFIAATLACAACNAQAPPTDNTPQLTQVVPEVTVEPEATIEASSVNWQTFSQAQPETPGWQFQHPEGWLVLPIDNTNVFVYSAPGIGERLFSEGLQPGQLIFQISLNPAASPDETPTDHINRLTSMIGEATISHSEPVTVAGIEGVEQRLTIVPIGVSAIAISRPFLTNRFIDIIAYSRADEFEANLPVINTVIETVQYVLATE